MNKITLVITFLLYQTLSSFAQPHYVWFVDANVQFGEDIGISWEHAFRSLQKAIDNAKAGDYILVASGTYRPNTLTDRNLSFRLKKGVKIYGGFNNQVEPQSVKEGDPVQNPTILTGNIGNRDIDTDNLYHVVDATDADSVTELDGFIITGGYASGAPGNPESIGGGLLLNQGSGNPRIARCRFEKNYASYGGAIGTNWISGNYTTPVIADCTFADNKADLYGGAIYYNSPAKPEKPFWVNNCTFSQNFGRIGGAIYLENIKNTNGFKKCVFQKNTSKADAGAVYTGLTFYFEKVTLVFDSCSFIGNTGSTGCVGVVGYTANPNDYFQFEMTHCALEGNKTTNSHASALSVEMGSARSNISVTDCHFSNNLSNGESCVLIESYDKSITDALFDKCTFINNKRWLWVGTDPYCFAIYARRGGDEGRTTLKAQNCLFAKNGGGIAHLNSSLGGEMESYLTNCTFYGNRKFALVKNWFNNFNGTTFYNNCHIKNSIFWDAQSSIKEMFNNNTFQDFSMYDFFIDHTLVSLKDSIIPGGPEAFGKQVIFNRYPLFLDTVNNNFQLAPCSPAADKGDNLAALGLTTDLNGLQRIQNDKIDLGAYESADSCVVKAMEATSIAFEVALAPNPVKAGETYTLSWEEGQFYGNVDLTCTLFDLGGKVVQQTSFPAGPGQHLWKAPDTAGIYFVCIGHAESRSGKTLKLIVLSQ